MDQLQKILSKTGDLNFKRRVEKMTEYLDIKPDDLVLDAGCGEGFYSMVFSNLYGCKVFAVDNDEYILDSAKSWNEGFKNIEFKKGDLTKIEFPENCFDKAVCTEVLEHIVDDKKAAAELFRVLKPGAVLAVTVPNKNYPFVWDPLNKIRTWFGLGHFNPKSEVWGGIWAYDHKRLYSPEEIAGLLENTGFKIEKTEVLTHYGIPFNHLILVLGKRFYTKMPVSEEIKNSMEKFKWDEALQEKNKNFLAKIISAVFWIFKKVDSLNNKEFDLKTSAMAVSIKAVKP